MQQQQYRANLPSPALAAAMLAVLLLATISEALGAARLWMLAAYALAVGVLAVQLVQSWRWRLTADEEGLTVDSGLGSRERLGWHEVEAIRTWPPAVERDGGRPIRLFLRPRTVRELDRHASDARDDPAGTLLEGTDRRNAASAFWAGSAPRFLLVVLVAAVLGTLLTVLTDGVARMTAAATGLEYAPLRLAVPVIPLAYCAFLLFARSLRAIVIGSLAAVGAMAAVAMALWGLAPLTSG